MSIIERSICVVTGTRAEYGLLRHLIQRIKRSDSFRLQLIVTGAHLSSEFGDTQREVEADGIEIDRRIDLALVSDTPAGIAGSTALGLTGFADAFESLRPDLLLVLGDRFEILSAAIAAMFARIPIAHLHGGERTEGLIDEAIRHSITKLSHLHFVAAEEYRTRVIQLGESPDRVFNVGGMGVDAIKRVSLLPRQELGEALGVGWGEKNLLITFHPVTLETGTSAKQMQELLSALGALDDTVLIFTMPNADTDGRAIFDLIRSFVHDHDNAYAFSSLGQVRYLSCIDVVDGVVGNSSSGLTEVPSFRKPTINIGDRQKGRVQATSVINCEPTKSEISAAIQRMYSGEFQSRLSRVRNPYGEGGASERIVDILQRTDFRNLLKKEFFDLAIR